MVAAYDDLISTQLAAYMKASSSLGCPVHTQATMVENLFHTQRAFLQASCGGGLENTDTGPSQADRIQQIQHFARDQVGSVVNTLYMSSVHEHPVFYIQVSSPYHHHLCYVGDTVDTLCWVVVNTRPYKVGTQHSIILSQQHFN